MTEMGHTSVSPAALNTATRSQPQLPPVRVCATHARGSSRTRTIAQPCSSHLALRLGPHCDSARRGKARERRAPTRAPQRGLIGGHKPLLRLVYSEVHLVKHTNRSLSLVHSKVHSPIHKPKCSQWCPLRCTLSCARKCAFHGELECALVSHTNRVLHYRWCTPSLHSNVHWNVHSTEHRDRALFTGALEGVITRAQCAVTCAFKMH